MKIYWAKTLAKNWCISGRDLMTSRLPLLMEPDPHRSSLLLSLLPLLWDGIGKLSPESISTLFKEEILLSFESWLKGTSQMDSGVRFCVCFVCLYWKHTFPSSFNLFITCPKDFPSLLWCQVSARNDFLWPYYKPIKMKVYNGKTNRCLFLALKEGALDSRVNIAFI